MNASQECQAVLTLNDKCEKFHSNPSIAHKKSLMWVCCMRHQPRSRYLFPPLSTLLSDDTMTGSHGQLNAVPAIQSSSPPLCKRRERPKKPLVVLWPPRGPGHALHRLQDGLDLLHDLLLHCSVGVRIQPKGLQAQGRASHRMSFVTRLCWCLQG